MSNRTFEAVFQFFKDELRDYEYMEAPDSYEHITEHGDGPFQEYATYKLRKSDRKPPASKTGISQRCDQLREEILRYDDVEFVKIIYGTHVTMEVYTAHSDSE